VSRVALAMLVLLTVGCQIKLNKSSTSAALSEPGGTEAGNPSSNPGPTPPSGPCTYGKAPEDLSISPLTYLRDPMVLFFLRGTASYIPFVSTDGGRTFPAQRDPPFDFTNVSSNNFYNNLGRISYTINTFVAGGLTGTAQVVQSVDNGLNYRSLSFPSLYRPPFLTGQSGYFVNADESLFIVDSRFVQNLTIPVGGTNFMYDQHFWQVRKISAAGAVTVMEEYQPAGLDGSEAMSVSVGKNGYLYAAGFTQQISRANGNLLTNLELRRSINGGMTWATLQSKALGTITGWDQAELFPAPDGSMVYFFHYLDSAGTGHSMVQRVNTDGSIVDRSAAVLGTELLSYLYAQDGSGKIAFVTYTADPKVRGIHILDMNTLTGTNLDFSFNPNDVHDSFEGARFLPETGDFVFSGYTSDVNFVKQKTYVEAITCH
jgi:hypothetical protein